jgi:hemoglobin-like flavoprotein
MGQNQSASTVCVDGNTANHNLLVPFSKKESQVIHRYLPDFIDVQGYSTKEDHDIILRHWEVLFSQVKNGEAVTASPIVQLFDNFYTILFELAPQVKPLFRSSMQVQGKALIRIVGSIRSMLLNPNMIAGAAELASRHVKYGVQCEHFNALGMALLRTLEKCSGDEWTKVIEISWRRVFTHVSILVVQQLHAQMHPQRWWQGPSKNNSRAIAYAPSNQTALSKKKEISKDATCPFSGHKLSEMPEKAQGFQHQHGQCPFRRISLIFFRDQKRIQQATTPQS